jgi:uncharacterized DUF497 family protein
MEFEWDYAKNPANIEKHGIDFDDAIEIFKGPILTQVDTRKDYGEVRILAIGIAAGVELLVVYTHARKKISFNIGKKSKQR